MPWPSMAHRERRVVRALCCVLSGSLVLLVTAPADGSPLSRARTHDAFALAYDLQFAASYDTLAEAVAADARDPAPHRAIAAVTWMEILFAQGVATFEAFTGEISKGDVARPTVSPGLAERFLSSIEQARSLASQQLARTDDGDAQYQVGATDALASLYAATVEGRTMAALSRGRRAVGAMERARERERGMREPGLILGLSQYTVSTMSWPVRTLARLGGFPGDRDAGLALLREAATPGAETETDALLLMMIVDNREGRHADALQRLTYLRRLHPRNRLLWLNHGASALAAGQPLEADQVLSEGMARHDLQVAPSVLGETALWLAHRGMARARLQRSADALADLQRGLSSGPRDWVSGRIHRQLGELALVAGERAGARREFEVAVEFSERGGDRTGVKEAKQRLSALKR